MSIKNIVKKSLLPYTQADLPDNLIGAAVCLSARGIATHAGILIRYNGITKIFHFDGETISLDDIDEGVIYYFRELYFIEPRLALSFLGHCQIVMEEARPIYGYFYAGSMYGDGGKFISAGDLPEYMTCVGFCLNFLKFFLRGKDFLRYNDWNNPDLGTSPGYVVKFVERVKIVVPEINVEAFTAGIRRIFPIEYITGAFQPKIPVSKSFIDSNKGDVVTRLMEYAGVLQQINN